MTDCRLIHACSDPTQGELTIFRAQGITKNRKSGKQSAIETLKAAQKGSIDTALEAASRDFNQRGAAARALSRASSASAFRPRALSDWPMSSHAADCVASSPTDIASALRAMFSACG
jgi:hypothetical protein